MHLRPWVTAIALGMILWSATKAEAQLVEVRDSDEIFAPYRERRSSHGWMFAVGRELYRPTQFFSTIDGVSYEDMFGPSDLPMIYFETGYKYNMAIGSISALVEYASGEISDSKIGELRTLKIERPSAKLMIILDSLTAEPYVAPYASFGLYQIGMDEGASANEVAISAQSKQGSQIKGGLLLQLNWLEEDVSRRALLNSGLENTYLDLFVAQYGKTAADADADFTSAMNWGAGLRVEF